MLKWVDTLDIAIELSEKHPDIDPQWINFVDLQKLVLELEDFDDLPDRVNEKILDAEHEGKPFFKALVEFMTSGPVIVQVLAGENAITLNRELMGNTNPKEADAGTIRADFAESIDANAVHGSDSPIRAQREIEYFFESTEMFG